MMRHARTLATFAGILSACTGGAAPDTDSVAQSIQALHNTPTFPVPRSLRTGLVQSAHRIAELQADSFGDHAQNGLSDDDPDDGGWDWMVSPSAQAHTPTASPDNLYGAVGFAPWVAMRIGAIEPRLMFTLQDCYLGIRNHREVDSPPDFVFLSVQSKLFRQKRFVQLARERYDFKIARAGGSDALGTAIRDTHHSAGMDALTAYDLAWLALSAMALNEAFPQRGYDADASTYVSIVVDELNSDSPGFDYRDAHEFSYGLGLAWAALVTSWDLRVGTLHEELLSLLLSLQLPDGAWQYGADYPVAHLQTTAHVLVAVGLMRRERHDLYDRTHRAATWLMAQQTSNGGWAYTSDQEYPQLNGDITLGVYLSQTRTTAFAIDTVDTAESALTARREPVTKPRILPPIIAPQ